MTQTKIIAVLLVAGQILCQSQSDESQQSSASITDFDPQILNYQLQQLAIQQYDTQSKQQPRYEAQTVQFAAQPQRYTSQSAQTQVGQSQPLTQQDYDAARILQAKLFEPYQGSYGNVQFQAAQYTAQQAAQAASVAPQPSSQQLAKQSLLGVAYSSATDASKTSFSGYGIKYSF